MLYMFTHLLLCPVLADINRTDKTRYKGHHEQQRREQDGGLNAKVTVNRMWGRVVVLCGVCVLQQAQRCLSGVVLSFVGRMNGLASVRGAGDVTTGAETLKQTLISVSVNFNIQIN